MYAQQSNDELKNASSWALAADFSTQEARQRGLQRTVQALFREDLLRRSHLIVEGSVSWLPLWSQQGILRFEGLHIGRISNCQISGSVSYYKTGERPQPISTASALLACVAPSLPHRSSPEDLQRFIRELDNSLENDVLCLSYRFSWAQQLSSEFGSQQANFLAAVRKSKVANPALLLEQWGTLGHPWHPNYKTKLGLTAEQVMALSPEFQPVIRVPLAAIRADQAYVELSSEGKDYRTWFAQTYPHVWAQWGASLRRQNQRAEDWLPLPVHPYQAQHLIPRKFSEELAAGVLLMLPEVSIAASPTMSFRTVVPEGSASMPHMKLPVSLRLTSVQRTVSPKSAVMGPRLTQLLNTILTGEEGFGGTLAILSEDVGLHYLDPKGDDDRARHLAVLFRANPMSKRTADIFPMPVGAMFASSPLSGRPLVTDMLALSYGDHSKGAIRFFERYAATVLAATLGPFLLYGIAFEAHQQNSFIMLNGQYEPVQLLARDFGDLRIHAPTLQRAGLQLIPYRAGFTLFEDAEPVRDKFLHATMLCHLAETGLLLARSYNESETHFWNVLRHETIKIFNRLRARTDPERWAEERKAILEDEWPAKSFLRMRLTDTSNDVHGSMTNPLIDTGS